MQTEEISFIAAVIAFALAGCSLVACIIIFFKLRVMDAIRFLRHRTVLPRDRGSVALKKGVPKTRGKKSKTNSPFTTKPQGAVVIEGEDGLRGGDQKLRDNRHAIGGIDAENPTDLLDAEEKTDVLGKNSSEADTVLSGGEEGQKSEHPTDVLRDDIEESENPTGVLNGEDSEHPTGVLVGESSERPTGVLWPPEYPEEATDEKDESIEDSEHPTGVLPEKPETKSIQQENTATEDAGMLDEEASENPTGVLPEKPSAGLDENALAPEAPTTELSGASDILESDMQESDAAERPTSILSDTPKAAVDNKNEVVKHRGDVVQHEEPSFRFILIHNEVVVHTGETIE